MRRIGGGRAARLFAAAALAAACALGCSAEEARRAAPRAAVEPLPYAVFLERLSVVPLDPGRRPDSLPYAVEERLRSRFAAAILGGLFESQAFARVDGVDIEALSASAFDSPAAYIEALSRSKADDAEARRAASDLRLRVTVGCFAESLPPSETDGWSAAGSSVVWFLSMVPAWFVPDTTFEPAVHAAFLAERSGRTSPRPIVLRSEKTSLDFVDRSGTGGYFLQFVCPPALVPPDAEVALPSLLEEAAAQLRSVVAVGLPGRLAADEVARGEPFLLAAPQSEGGGPLVFVPGKLLSLEADGKPLGGEDAAALERALLDAREKSQACAELRKHLGSLAPGEPVPALEEIERAYPNVYRAPALGADLGERRVRASFARSEGASPEAATWTLPARGRSRASPLEDVPAPRPEGAGAPKESAP